MSLPVLDFLQVFAIEPVRMQHEFVAEPVIACLVAADQENCRVPRITCVEYAKGLSAALNAKLPHVTVSRTHNTRTLRKRQCRPKPHQQLDRGGHGLLLANRKRVPPLP